MANKITESINNGFEKYLEKNGVNLKEVLNESNTPKKESKNINEAKRPMAKRKAPRPKRGVKSPADLARELENGTLGENLNEANKFDDYMEKTTRKQMKGFDVDDSTAEDMVKSNKALRRRDKGERAHIDWYGSQIGHNYKSPAEKALLKHKRHDDLSHVGPNNEHKVNASSFDRLGNTFVDLKKKAGYYDENLNESAISFEDLKNTVSDALENIVYKYMHETGTVVSKEDLEKAIQFFENTFWSDPDAIFESYKRKRMNRRKK